MESVCFYFRVHQPFPLREYDFSMIGEDHVYEAKDTSLLDQIADKYYLPNNKLLLKLIRNNKSNLKIVFSMSGCAVEQFALHRPDVLVSFQKLAKTGKIEFLEETYYHSLSFLYSATEFERQVKKHHDKMKSLFGKKPKTLHTPDTTNIYADYEAFAVQCQGKDLPNVEALIRHIYEEKQMITQSIRDTFMTKDGVEWLDNTMQKEAIRRIYSLEEKVLKSKNENVIDTWGRLQTSDYFYYMSTKTFKENDLCKKYNPYSSPFDAYINYMNIISDFENTLP
ncbi:MAG: hypothetical protein EAZ08_08900 [Cytophagales bacterium]|nr:MAG: hypothetical protein EAZ08_08900 [Cytophagales bacterium]